MPQHNINNIIASLYDSLIDHDSLSSTLDNMAKQVGAICTDYYLLENNKIIFNSIGGSISEAQNDHIRYFHDINPRINYINSLKQNDLFCDIDYIGREKMSKMAFYQDFLRRYKTGICLAAAPLKTQSQQALSGFHYHYDAGPPTEDQRQLAKIFLRHIGSFSRLKSHFRSEHFEDYSYRNKNEKYQAIIVFDQSLNIRFVNDLANYFNQNFRIIENSKLNLDKFLNKNSFISSLKECKSFFSSIFRLKIGEFHHFNCSLFLTPPFDIGKFNIAKISHGSFVIFIDYRPENKINTHVAMLRFVYDLTPMEAEVSQEILNGYSASEISSKRGVTINTTRTQIQSVLQKTGQKRQSDLIRLIYSLSHSMGS